ncbi:unnamed protein product [Clavelina lepadiformis]|uniref:Long-chain-fatty-acid--CoA ligase n=1 Tax=Clavelina lepadiformis TaxID=159417 RepID=A0ABP0F412_CLALP
MSSLTAYVSTYSQYLQQLTTSSWAGIGAIAVAALIWLTKNKNEKSKQDHPIDLENQSVKITYEGDDNVRASPLMLDEPVKYLEADTRTMHDIFLRGLRESNNGNCLGWRPGPGQPFKWLSYQQVLDRVQNFGSGLIAEGAETKPTQLIGIFSQNCIDWKIAEQACNSYSMVVVPLYDTLGPQSIQHVINQCDLKFLVVDTNTKANVLLNGVKDNKYKFDVLITMETPNDQVASLSKEVSVKVITFDGLEEIGKTEKQDFVPPTADDLHTICYTSGTTGLPKGVMLTHENVVATLAGVFCIGKDSFLNVSAPDVHISYLPLAHMFERIVQAQVLFAGASIGFFQGDIKLLLDDVKTLRPTIFPMVPRLINRVYDKIWAGASQSTIKKFLLTQAVKAKVSKLQQGIVTKDTIWDKLVFRKIQDMLGGRLRICITGAAPVSLEVISFMRAALGVPFMEGYGQTETTAPISITVPGDYMSGSVGTVVACNIVKLVDVPEKNYFAKDGKGEVCAKGTNVFKGYYKDEVKTKEAVDEDGWLHTGDVGMWLPNGALKIIDRKKHIFKLAQGEYIAPEKVEGILVQSPSVAQVFLHGESLKASLVAIVIPDPEMLVMWCSGKGVKGSYEELCTKEKVKKLILDDLCAVGKKRGLHSFELPKKIHLSTEMFTVENDLLTPTFKSRRPQLYKRYEEEIVQMYEGLD